MEKYNLNPLKIAMMLELLVKKFSVERLSNECDVSTQTIKNIIMQKKTKEATINKVYDKIVELVDDIQSSVIEGGKK